MKKFCYILFLFHAVFIISSSALAAVVKVDPESVNISNVGVGNTFNVNIAIENVTNIGGFEFELQYDNAVVTIENDSVSIGAFLSSSGRSVSLLKNIDTAGLLKAGAFSYGDPIGPDGNGVLIQVTFTVQSLAESALDLKNVILTDTSAASIAVDTTTDGAVTAIAETLTVQVTPASVTLNNIGNTFDAEIMIQGVKNLGSFEFKLKYNPAIVKIVNDTYVTLGAFLESTGRTPTLLGPNVDNDTGLLDVGAFSFGDQAGPNGSGVLMKIKFTVQSLSAGQLDLKDVLITDISAVSIPVGMVKDGNLLIPVEPDPDSDPVVPPIYESDSDGDGTPNYLDKCPDDPDKVAEGSCGCGVEDTDTDEDGTPDCNDKCPNDPAKTEEGTCGCSIAETDTDNDGTPDCNDKCSNDPAKTEEGICGCSVADTDTDGDGTPDCNDPCVDDPNNACNGPGLTPDTDGDGVLDSEDGCPNDPNKTDGGTCGCGITDTDTDSDGTLDCNDKCPNDPAKIEEGACGCGITDTDTDNDGTPDCNDPCSDDPENKCDSDNDGTSDDTDACPDDPNKTEPGTCGCGVADIDSDRDGTFDCEEGGDGDGDNCFINTTAHGSMGMLSGIFSFLALCIGISVRNDRISKK